MKAIKILDKTLEIGTLITFSGVILVVLIQIMSRYLSYTAIWTEELTRFLFIYAISFSAPLALKQKEFINVDLLIQFFPDKIKRFYEAGIYFTIVLFCCMVAFYSYEFMLLGKGQTSATMTIDMSFIHASIGLSMLFIGVYSLLHVIDYLRGTPERGES